MFRKFKLEIKICFLVQAEPAHCEKYCILVLINQLYADATQRQTITKGV